MIEDLKPSANTQIQPAVVDPHRVPVQFVDWIVTSGVGPAPGIVNIDFAALDFALSDDAVKPEAIMQCRLRMSLLTAQNVVNALQQLLDALKPAGPADAVN